jgi:hypothetical protein
LTEEVDVGSFLIVEEKEDDMPSIYCRISISSRSGG